MELRHLRSFLAVAEHLNFARAAKSLNLSQPALSVQIRALEDDMAIALFVRNRRTTSLTPAGQVLIEEARQILRQAELAVSRARRAALGYVGTLRIGFISTAAGVMLPLLVPKFRELYPDVELELRNVLTRDQVVQLSDRSLDVGLLRVPINTSSDEIQLTVLHREPFLLLLPGSHALAHKRQLRLEDLKNERFVMYTRRLAPGFHDLILGILNGAGFSPHIVQEASEMYTLASLVAAGLGVAIAPSSVSLHHTSGVVCRKLPRGLPVSEIALAVNKNNVSATTQLFINLALEAYSAKPLRDSSR